MDLVLASLVVAVGGSIGALARYAIGELARVWSRLPGWVGILIANLGGCVLIGLFANLLAAGPEVADAPSVLAGTSREALLWRGLLIAGTCGSLTTFSTFSLDTLMLFYEGRLGYLLLNVAASVAGGIAGTVLGLFSGGVL
jgi:CrcB protein